VKTKDNMTIYQISQWNIKNHQVLQKYYIIQSCEVIILKSKILELTKLTPFHSDYWSGHLPEVRLRVQMAV